MNEHHTENERSVPVSATTRSRDNYHGSLTEGSNTSAMTEGSAGARNTDIDCDESSVALKHTSMGDKERGDNTSISEREHRAIENKNVPGELKHEDKEREESPLSNIAAFSKDHSAHDKFTGEGKDFMKADKRHDMCPAGEDKDFMKADKRHEMSPAGEDKDSMKANKKHDMSPTSTEYKFNECLKEAEEQFEYFWQKYNPFSQWYKSSFKANGRTFTCAEQYMMYTKAVLLHDDGLAKQIMQCEDPSRIKRLGRKTEQFSEDLWIHNCLHVVKAGNMAKFQQNTDIKDELFATYPRILVEASPYDKVWGIGVEKRNQCAWNEATWEGTNLLGYILTEVRDQLMFEAEIIDENHRKVYLEKLTNKLENMTSGNKGAYDRYPGHDYRGRYHDDKTSGGRRSDHNHDYPRDDSPPAQENNRYRNQRDGKMPREDDGISGYDQNVREHGHCPRKSKEDNATSAYHDTVKNDKYEHDNAHLELKKGKETALSETRPESKNETGASAITEQRSSCSNVQMEKKNKNANPRCTKKENSEPDYSAVCMERLDPEKRLYKPECN